MKMDVALRRWSTELATAPLGRKLFGRHVVLFRDANGTAHALGACCPHRGTDLTKGAVVGGCIQCPFHGWRFNGVGQCVRVPSQPESRRIPPRRACLPIHCMNGEELSGLDGAGEMQRGEPPEDSVGQPGLFVRRVFFDPHSRRGTIPRRAGKLLRQSALPFIP